MVVAYATNQRVKIWRLVVPPILADSLIPAVAVMGRDAMGLGLEEEFGAFRFIDFVVEGGPAGTFRFFHAGVAAAEIGYTCRPDFLRPDGRHQLAVEQGIGLNGRKQFGMLQMDLQKVMQAAAVDEFIPGQVDAVIPAVVFDNVALTGLKQFHTVKYSYSPTGGDVRLSEF